MSKNNLFINNIDVVIFDIDNTLIFGVGARNYYSLYSQLIEGLVAKKMGISLIEAKTLVDKIREENDGRGELILDKLNLQWDWYDEILKLDPNEYIKKIPETVNTIQSLKGLKKKLVALTDGPLPQVNRILESAGLACSDFDLIIGWKKGEIKPKSGNSSIFRKICFDLQCNPRKTAMIGDSLEVDILPAIKAGMKTVLISKKKTKSDRFSLRIPSLEELLALRLIE